MGPFFLAMPAAGVIARKVASCHGHGWNAGRAIN